MTNDFKLLLGSSKTVDEHKVAKKQHDQNVTKEIKPCINEDRAGNGNGSSRLSYNKRMMAKLQEAASQPVTSDRKITSKRKQESKGSLCDFSNKTSRKTKKGSNAIKGWSLGGKQYVHKMMGKINQDEQSGLFKKWEIMHQKLCLAASLVKEEGRDEQCNDTFEMDCVVAKQQVNK
jgi:hypothetical protein